MWRDGFEINNKGSNICTTSSSNDIPPVQCVILCVPSENKHVMGTPPSSHHVSSVGCGAATGMSPQYERTTTKKTNTSAIPTISFNKHVRIRISTSKGMRTRAIQKPNLK